MMVSSSSGDSCSALVAGNYDVIVNEPVSFRSILTDFVQRFEQHEAELEIEQQQQQQQQHLLDSGYSSEFKLLKEFSKTLKEDKANLIEGELDFNLRKNRYKDIIPFAHTRVILNSDPQVPGSDYINANYVRGPSGAPRAYIACQGPLSCTLNDFWRMIWECNVSVVIMACNEYESGKPKCKIYWPEEVGTSQFYGNIQVTLVKVRQICPDFLIRKFSVKLILQPKSSNSTNNMQQDTFRTAESNGNVCAHDNECKKNLDKVRLDENCNNKKETDHPFSLPVGTTTTLNGDINYARNNNRIQRMVNKLGDNYQSNNSSESRGVILEKTICQFHYTTWPDHGVPDSVQPILDLVRLVRDVQPAEDQPILVHCSAGCGRTGTICCIDYVWGLMRQGRLDASFDLCNIISEMRQQRMSMVQTLEQYILCHRAVAALFMKQLKLIDNHVYENLDSIENDGEEYGKVFADDAEEFGPVFI